MRTIHRSILILGILTLLCCCAKNVPSIAEPNDESFIEKDSIEGPIAEGCPDTLYDDWRTSNYVLPYPVGKGYVVTLSHCGGSYHSKGQPDEFAIDFAMDIGMMITAAREGEVVYIEESGIDGEFPNNLVVIEHDDGTFAQYMHLTKDGALVEVGQSVSQGSEIGLSGNTGLAGFPHLHFIVTEPGTFNYPYNSIPTTFSNTISNERSLAKGHRYLAYPFK